MTEFGWPPSSEAERDQATTFTDPPGRGAQAEAPRDRTALSGRFILSWLLGAAGLGAIVGLSAGLLDEPIARNSASYVPGSEPTTSGAATGLTNPPVAAPSVGNAGAEPVPSAAAFAASPWRANGLELSRVYGISQTSDGRIQMNVDRLTVYSGASAKAFYQQHPDQTPAPLATINQNPRRYRFTVASGSPIYASTLVGREGTPSAVSAKAFADGVQAALDDKRTVYVWLRHDDTDGGWVTYVAEAQDAG